MGFQNWVLRGGHIFIEVDIYIGRLTMPMGSGDQGDRYLGANFLFWSYLSWLVIYRVPKSGDAHFYPHLRPGAYRDFEENEGISLQTAPKLSRNGHMKPQKYSQAAEDFNFGFEKFPLVTLQKFPPPENNIQSVGIVAGCAFWLRYTHFAYCSQVVEISEVLPMEISRKQS